MSFLHHGLSNHGGYHELVPVSTAISHSTGGYGFQPDLQNSLPADETSIHGLHETGSQGPDAVTGLTGAHDRYLPQLGKPTFKKRLHVMDIIAGVGSFTCLALAITAVANESVSWRLGVGNRQLIVAGFLLSLMNLSLGSVAPTLFLLLEARFGSSKLQNYDGIIRNQFMSSNLSFVWRTTLLLMLALPIGLGVAYKSFSGGRSVMAVNAAAFIGNGSYYGMFAPPGLQTLGERTGISLFFNATLPFAVANAQSQNAEPPLPEYPAAYGYNVLLLSQNSSAALDLPQPSYVSAVQGLLHGNESWLISAPILGTVATFNQSSLQTQLSNGSFFKNFCAAAQASSGAITHQSMMNAWSIVLLDQPSPGNQSIQYIALSPDPGINYAVTCDTLRRYAQPFDVTRRQCYGTWSITRTELRLVDGTCGNAFLPAKKQLVITDNTMFLGVWYMSSLVESLGPFATSRNNSAWTRPFLATGIASMLWSRITILNSATNLEISHGAPVFAGVSLEDAGLIYSVDDTVFYIRSTLRKSWLLYTVFAIQPLLILIILGLIMTFHSVPVDRGFGLISILAGVDHDSLPTLAGASLSGQLVKDVNMIIRPSLDGKEAQVKYTIVDGQTAKKRRSHLDLSMIYH